MPKRGCFYIQYHNPPPLIQTGNQQFIAKKKLSTENPILSSVCT